MIYLHELVHTAMTAIGLRPRPTAHGSRELCPVPVMVALYRPGEAEPYAIVPAQAFAAHAAREDEQAELTLSVILPAAEGGAA